MPADSYACVLDPLDVLAHLAVLTRRVQLGTSAVLTLLQPPVLLARRVTEVGIGHIVLQVAAPPEATLDALADLRERRLDR